MSKEADRNWQELANAVIVQAAKDYRLAQYRIFRRLPLVYHRRKRIVYPRCWPNLTRISAPMV